MDNPGNYATPIAAADRVDIGGAIADNAGVTWDADNWKVSLTGKNLTDEEHFRSNFPNLFGSQVVLPELPRHRAAKVGYRF